MLPEHAHTCTMRAAISGVTLVKQCGLGCCDGLLLHCNAEIFEQQEAGRRVLGFGTGAPRLPTLGGSQQHEGIASDKSEMDSERREGQQGSGVLS